MKETKIKIGDSVKIKAKSPKIPNWMLRETAKVNGEYVNSKTKITYYTVIFKNGFKASFNKEYLEVVPEKDSLDVLSKVSGISKKEVRAIFEEVKRNHKLLDGCIRPHDFIAFGKGPMRNERCTRCNGVVSSSAANYYKQGLKDAKK